MNNVKILDFFSHGEEGKGRLTSYEKETGVPFEIQRVYTVTQVEEKGERGHHAHRKLEQIFIALQGEIVVDCEDNEGNHIKIELKPNGKALYCGPWVWHTLSYRNHAILMVLASEKYLEADYIRDYFEFKTTKN